MSSRVTKADLVEAETRVLQRQEALAVLAEGLRLLRQEDFPARKRDRMAVVLENLAGAAARDSFNEGALKLAEFEVQMMLKFLRLRPVYINPAGMAA